jgi:single-stranded DNA-binding protein
MAAGVLVRDPERRAGAKGIFGTATIRAGAGENAQWISIIAFGEAADRLLSLHAVDAVSAAGRAEIKSWTDRSGAERHGLSIVASEVIAARPRPRSPRPRPAYPPPQARDLGPPLDDRLDDLWPVERVS